MATSGALNGTDVFLRILTDTGWESLGGQLSHTETLNNKLIDITNKIGSSKYRELLPDEGTQSVDYTVELVFCSQAGFDYLRSIAGTKAVSTFQVIHTDVPTGTVETKVKLQVQSFTDTSSDGEALTASVSLLSSDSFDYAMAQAFSLFVPSGSDSLLTSNGQTYYARA